MGLTDEERSELSEHFRAMDRVWLDWREQNLKAERARADAAAARAAEQSERPQGRRR